MQVVIAKILTFVYSGCYIKPLKLLTRNLIVEEACIVPKDLEMVVFPRKPHSRGSMHCTERLRNGGFSYFSIIKGCLKTHYEILTTLSITEKYLMFSSLSLILLVLLGKKFKYHLFFCDDSPNSSQMKQFPKASSFATILKKIPVLQWFPKAPVLKPLHKPPAVTTRKLTLIANDCQSVQTSRLLKWTFSSCPQIVDCQNL